MNRVLMVVAAMCFVDSVRAQDGLSVVGSDYFPIAVGSRWEYTAGVGKFSSEVIKHEQIGGVMCACIESKIEGLLPAVSRLLGGESPPEPVQEYVHVSESGAYRHQNAGKDFNPPLPFLKFLNATKKEDVWKVESRHGDDSFRGTYSQSVDSITIRGKKYEDVLVVKSDIVDGSFRVKETSWFARGVGLIKKSVETELDTEFGTTSKTELLKFSPGPDPNQK